LSERNVYNYFEQPDDGDLKDNTLTITGTSKVDGQTFTSEEFRLGINGQANVNPTEGVVPYRGDDVFKDSPVTFDEINDILVSSSPAILPLQFRIVSTAGSLLATDQVVQCDTGGFDFTLLDATLYARREFTIYNTGASVVNVKTILSQTINDASVSMLDTNDSIGIFSNGVNWRII